MQFLWRYIDDLVGKGLDINVIGELFFYAALTMVPMALPLAILLASLMTFGNLGEKFELTAMKASGVSLLKTMRPLIILMAIIATGAFFFQNNALPVAQTKMWTLLYSIKQQSPEMEIPEKTFYDQIQGYNIYVESKDKLTGTLRDLTIYDVSAGFDNSRIIVADSGRIATAQDKTHLLLNIYNGEQYENLHQQPGSLGSGSPKYRRESFKQKDVIIGFDANFSRMDESTMRKQYIGKNISELNVTIDSIQHRLDSIGDIYASELISKPYYGIAHTVYVNTDSGISRVAQKDINLDKPLSLDSLFNHNSGVAKSAINAQALANARQIRQDIEFKSYTMGDDRKSMRRHAIEMHKKFTLSFAIIIFFFIGAPLGAIIRKGGIGTPLVISVLLFIVYYIIDNTGYKMAREGHLEVFEGMWLSSAVLLPLGLFLTYKAMHDSSVFNIDAYKAFIQKVTGKRKRSLEPKQFTMEEVEPAQAIALLSDFDAKLQSVIAHYATMNRLQRWLQRPMPVIGRAELYDGLNRVVDYLSNSRSYAVIAYLNEYPYDIRKSNLAKMHDVNISLVELFNNNVSVSETVQPNETV
jgi:lipopolysaccharide export system permease protein